MDLLRNLYGTILSAFRISLGANQIQLKNNSGALDIRDKDDVAYVIVRGDHPVADNDLTTKLYVDKINGNLIIGRQADCSVALPNNTASRGFVMPTTLGVGGLVLGDVLYDNGLNDGQPMEILAKRDGQTVAITTALTGGTYEFDVDSLYMWDEIETTSWKKVADLGHHSGPIRTVRFVIDNSAAQNSTFKIPASCRIINCQLEVTTPYSAGATISIGYTGTVDAIMTTAQNSPQDAGAYSVEQDTAWNATEIEALVTISGAPAVGAGVVFISFTEPNA